MQKTMYAIVEKATREILGSDFMDIGEEMLLIDKEKSNLETLLFAFNWAGPDGTMQTPGFDNAQVVPVNLTWE